MESFLETIRYGFAVVLLAALPASPKASQGWRPAAGRRSAGEPRLTALDTELRKPSTLPVGGGIAAGGTLAFAYAAYDVRTLAEGIVMLAATPFFAAMLLPAAMTGWRAREIAWRAATLLLTAQRTAALASFVVYESLDRVHVLNTELLLFYGGIAFGAALLAIAGVTLSRLAARVARASREPVAAAVVVLLLSEHLCWGYYALVLDGVVSLPESLFAPLVYVINHIRFFGHAQTAVAVLFVVGCLLFRDKPEAAHVQLMNAARRRKYLWKIRLQWRHATVFLLAAALATGVGAYYRLYADRPPQLSAAQHLEPKDGRFVIDVSDFEPEEFHRYAYADGEGRVIRFFVLKDESGMVRAAYDACRFCGTKGYLKQGKDLVCLACGAAIYAPTVGREGGCNPIPLTHSTQNGALIIAERDLVNGDGAIFFSGDEAH